MSQKYTQIRTDNPVTTPVTGDEIFVVVQDGESRGIILSELPGGATPGIDDVLAEAQALTDDRDITVGLNILRETATDGATHYSQRSIQVGAVDMAHCSFDNTQQAIVSVEDGILITDTYVNRGLQGQADFSPNLQANDYAQYSLIVATDTTGTAISFAKPQIYGTEGAPETGNITIVTTGLVKGMTQLLIHNNGSEPTYGSEIKIISGAYATGELNYIMLMAVSSSRILATISQEV